MGGLLKKNYCPQCGSENVVIAEPSSGQWMCRECYYCGNDFPEETVIGRPESSEALSAFEHAKKTVKIKKVKKAKKIKVKK